MNSNGWPLGKQQPSGPAKGIESTGEEGIE